jgi:hypothetical protein
MHQPESNQSAVADRRRALKLGIYAAYTAPALLALMTSSKAAAQSTPAEECPECLEGGGEL